MKISVIGAGIGGLATAAILSSRGHDVDLFEQREITGGKIQEKKINGFRFDTGPSFLTMPFVVEKVFNLCNKDVSDYLEWTTIEPICRYQFPDGSCFFNYLDPKKNRDELMRVAPEDNEAWNRFLDYSANIYRHTSTSFLFNTLQKFSDLDINTISDFMRMDAFTTVAKRVDEFFNSSKLRQVFKRFPACNGSSPYLAPATLNVIPYLTLRLGGYYIKGGMYNLVRALLNLAEDCGVNIHTDTPVDLVIPDPAQKRRISGIMIDGSLYESDVVVSNIDAATTYFKLFPEKALSRLKKRKISRLEPSISGFVVMLGINRIYEQLEHHNIFFSEDYDDELKAIFEHRELPMDPTVYLSNTSRTEPDDAPPGCSNLFLLVHTPYTDKGQFWHEWKETYTDHIILTLESRGLKRLRDAIVVCETITPADFERLYNSYRGNLYGSSTNNRSATMNRPRNKSPWFNNLYLCGGNTHPGGSIPMVLQSAINASSLIKRDYAS